MYHIKNIKITTKNNVMSELPLEKGLNIIFGPSNTGKTLVYDCINFLMGCKGYNKSGNKNLESESYHRLADPKLKIQVVSMLIDLDGDEIVLSREIDSSDINISSISEKVESGTYTVGNPTKKKGAISSVWLKLMGIDDEGIFIYQYANGSVQALKFRTFAHVLLVNEDRITSGNSVLKKQIGYTNNIPVDVISSLLYFKDEISTEKPSKDGDDDKIITARKSAVQMMYDRSLSALAEQDFIRLKDQTDQRSVVEIELEINNLLQDIEAAESSLDDAISKNQELTALIIDIDDKIAESKMLKDRYASLRTQYESDIRRLTFIAEGELHRDSIPKISVCPFCNGELQKEKSESCIEAAEFEVEKISLKIKDLREADLSIDEEISRLLLQKSDIVNERNDVQSLIRGELKPRVDTLRESMASYVAALERAKVAEMVKEFSSILKEQYEEITKAEDDKDASEPAKLDIEKIISERMKASMTDLLEKILKECDYDNFVGARFDSSLCDVVVNGSEKMSQGKGFKAFLNTIMAMAIQEWLEKEGRHQLQLLLLDSPILSLKEKEENIGTQKTSSGMRNGLFKYFVDHRNDRQTIVLENEIPNIDYEDTNLIHFSRVEGQGRFGLLLDYRE